MNTSLTKFYRVRAKDAVTLKIRIGYAQIGTTIVYLDKQELVSGAKNAVELEIPGSGKKLDGKTLYCSTIVADVRTETNKTSVTYELAGGAKPFKQTLQQNVDSEGDSEWFTASFHFYV